MDLQEHRLIELLPDREADTLADWLKANPGAEIISRDRSGDYATGARRGAPTATQVADRWHLHSNWRRSVEAAFDRHRGRIKRVVLPTPEPVGKPAASVLPAKSVNRRRNSAEERSARAQARRLALYNTIQERYAKGEYLKTIARDLEIDFRTARKYALSEECPTRKPHKWSRGRLPGPYEPYLRARWEEGCKNGRGLYREIKAHGYPGSRTQVAVFVALLRREENDGKSQPAPASGEPLTPHKASMLLLRRPERRSEEPSPRRSRSYGTPTQRSPPPSLSPIGSSRSSGSAGGEAGRVALRRGSERGSRDLALCPQGPTGRSGGASGLHAGVVERTDGRPDHEVGSDQAQHVREGEVRSASSTGTLRGVSGWLTVKDSPTIRV